MKVANFDLAITLSILGGSLWIEYLSFYFDVKYFYIKTMNLCERIMKSDFVDDMLDQWSTERPDLDTSSLSVVARILRLNKPLLQQAEAALGPLELSVREYDVLSALRRQGSPFRLPATELAETTGLSSGAMTNRIDKLILRGLVHRKADRQDRRGVNISLSAKGLNLVDEATRLRLLAADAALAGLQRAERNKLASLLRKLILSSAESDHGGP